MELKQQAAGLMRDRISESRWRGASKMAKQVKAFATEADCQVPSPGPTQWKESNDSHMLSTDSTLLRILTSPAHIHKYIFTLKWRVTEGLV